VAPGPLFQGGGRADKMRVEESEWSNAGWKYLLVICGYDAAT
jgi:hypothetical protein